MPRFICCPVISSFLALFSLLHCTNDKKSITALMLLLGAHGIYAGRLAIAFAPWARTASLSSLRRAESCRLLHNCRRQRSQEGCIAVFHFHRNCDVDGRRWTEHLSYPLSTIHGRGYSRRYLRVTRRNGQRMLARCWMVTCSEAKKNELLPDDKNDLNQAVDRSQHDLAPVGNLTLTVAAGSPGDNKALEELEERATHAGLMEGTKRLSEQIAARIEKRSGAEAARQSSLIMERAGERIVSERAAELAGERFTEIVGERASNQVAQRAGERWGDSLASNWGKRVAESTGEQMVKVGEQFGERIVERTGQHLGESLNTKLGERLGDSTLKRLVELGGEGTAERFVSRKLSEPRSATLWKRITELTGKRWVERTGERSGERIAGRTGERLGESVSSNVGERLVELTSERILLERTGEHTVSSTIAHSMAGTRVAGREILLRRLGRGILIAVPLLGGMFALYLWRQDVTRAVAERKKVQIQRAKQRKSLNGAWLLFALASCADVVDAACHFSMAYTICTGALGLDTSPMLEAVSVVCAVTSTACAVGGEVWSARHRELAECISQPGSPQSP